MRRNRIPVASDPVNGGKGQIFGSPMEDLSQRRLVMQQHVLEGTAVRYAPAEEAELGLRLWNVERVEEASYKTRAYVVRPADPVKFNA